MKDSSALEQTREQSNGFTSGSDYSWLTIHLNTSINPLMTAVINGYLLKSFLGENVFIRKE